MSVENLNIGIIGVAGRPKTFIGAILDHEKTNLTAVCGRNQENAKAAVDGIKNVAVYADYREMIDNAGIDAVIIGTPMPLHAEQTVYALNKNLHVLSEVAPAVSVAELRSIKAAAKKSVGTYMMAENAIYSLNVMTVANMADAGVLGELYYAESEYLHNCAFSIEATPWRGEWLYGKRGLTYSTHNLGPVLRWFKGDRIGEVTCAGSGNHYNDAGGNIIAADDTTIMLCRTERGRLIKIRVDLTGQRPYCMSYVLNGTNGCFSSSRHIGDRDMIHIGAGNGQPDIEWSSWEEIAAKYEPEIWKKCAGKDKSKCMHESDYILMTDYLDAVCSGNPPPISLDEAMDMTLPGLVTQEYFEEASRGWVKVPDPRDW